MSADTGFSTVVVFIILEETSKLKKQKTKQMHLPLLLHLFEENTAVHQ